MIIDVWKVKVVRGYESTFEQLCKKRNMPIKPLSKHKKGNYQVVGPEEALLDIGLFIASFEKMPFGIVYPGNDPLFLF